MTDQLTETQEVTWEELYENVQDDNPNLGLRRLKEMMERLDPCRYESFDSPLFMLGASCSCGVCTPHRLRVTGPVSAVPTIWIDENSRMDE